jgi:hypothetical protein
MPVNVLCNACEKSYKVSRKLGGKSVKCPGCGGPIKVPLAAGVAAGAAATSRQLAPAAVASEGDYDLAALAAAEAAAVPLEDRVYTPTQYVEQPKTPEVRRLVPIAEVRRSRSSGGGNDFVAMIVGSPMFYFQLLAVALIGIGFAMGQLLPLLIGVLALLPLALISFVVGYLKAVVLTAQRWPIFGITGAAYPLYYATAIFLVLGGSADTLMAMQHSPIPFIVLILNLVTLGGFIAHLVVDFGTMARALIFGIYFVMDIFLIVFVSALAQAAIQHAKH